jgi:hypothetical protein
LDERAKILHSVKRFQHRDYIIVNSEHKLSKRAVHQAVVAGLREFQDKEIGGEEETEQQVGEPDGFGRVETEVSIKEAVPAE